MRIARLISIVAFIGVAVLCFSGYAHETRQAKLGQDTAARVIDPTHPQHRMLTGVLREGWLTYPDDESNWYPPHGAPQTVHYYYLHLSSPVDLLSDKWNDNVLHQYDIGLVASTQVVRKLSTLVGGTVIVSGDFPRGPAAVAGVPMGLQMTVWSVRPTNSALR